MNTSKNSTMSASTGQSITDKIQLALQRYIPERCMEIVHILQQASHKELHIAFPYLVENIFSVGTTQSGWGLMELTRSQRSYDFSCVLDFLSAKGPILDVAYKLLADGRTQYEFPISCLPATTRKMLDEGNIPSLYSNKVPYCGPGRSTTHVMLNPFEFYFFHFAYFAVNPAQSKDAVFPSSLVDSLYPSLLEDYLSYFLPTDGKSVSPIPHSLMPQYRTPTYSSPPYLPIHPNYRSYATPGLPYEMQHFPSQGYCTPQNFFYKRNILTSTPTVPSTEINISSDEIWRSRTLLRILIEFWLSLSSDDLAELSFNCGSFQEAFVPSHIQMQLVRLLVKHIHYFANSAIDTSDSSPIANLSYQTQNPMEELKRTIVIQQLQKMLYNFLKLSFERWPLDCYFRLALETWLSYIQPWRYDVNNTDIMDNRYQQNDSKKAERAVHPKWKDFVTENLLFYTSIFQKLLPRFFRLELHNVRNAYLLLRVTKVFTQINLQEMIMDAEKKIQEPVFLHSQIFQTSSVSQPRQFIQDLEGMAFEYEPMFGANVRAQVLSLLVVIRQSQQRVLKMEADIRKVKKGWFQSVADLFSFENSDNQEASLADIGKMQLFLETAKNHFCAMFKLSVPPIPSTPCDSSLPCDNSEVVQEDRLNRTGIPDQPSCSREVAYKGNPDLQPIRSYEVAFLVRLFFHLSEVINEKYQNDINSLFSRRDWLGRISRQLLAAPTVCQSWSPSSHTQVTKALPPRVSLRILAHRQLLAYLGFFYFLAYLLGYGPFTFVLLATGLVLIYAIFRAIFLPR